MSQYDAREFLERVFSAKQTLGDLTQSPNTFEVMQQAAKEAGLDFTLEEIKQALVERLSDEKAVNIMRYCFSEMPCI